MAREAEKERKTKVEPSWRDDCGWGRPSSEFAGVHFKTFVRMSLHILESYACKRDDSLHARSPCPPSDCNDFTTSQLACDVDEYMRRLRTALDGELDEDLCTQYVTFYKNARTPGRQCTEQEYRSFLDVFQELLRRIQR